jgi:gas vesicle structural protein
MADQELEIDEDEELSLLETLDHVIDHGLVLAGEVTISVAGVDLIFLGLNVLLGSVETVERVLGERERRVELLLGQVTRTAFASIPAAEEAHEAAPPAEPSDGGGRPTVGRG